MHCSFFNNKLIFLGIICFLLLESIFRHPLVYFIGLGSPLRFCMELLFLMDKLIWDENCSLPWMIVYCKISTNAILKWTTMNRARSLFCFMCTWIFEGEKTNIFYSTNWTVFPLSFSMWIRYLTGVWTWAEVLKYSYYLEHLYSWFQKVGILMTHPKRLLEFFVFKLAFEPSGWINVIVKPSLIYLPYKRE